MTDALPLVFHPAYVPPDSLHFARLAAVAAMAKRCGLGREHVPAPLSEAVLKQLHDPLYVDDFLAGRQPLAGSSHLPWSSGLVDAVRLMLGGQKLGASLAWEHGVAINLACGFHHAHPQRGGGFCVFNGLALLALLHPERRIAVLDCDEHGGDGTEAFAERLHNLHTISVFGTRFGLRGGVRSRLFRAPDPGGDTVDDGYLRVIDESLDALLLMQPDLVVYQAGMDSHRDDPRATLKLRSETLATRDQRVFAALATARLPVLCVLAGAYQPPARVAQLYEATFRAAAAAHQVWRMRT